MSSYLEGSLRARIIELEQKLDMTTSMSAADRYQAELTGHYEKLEDIHSKAEKDKA